MQRDNIPGKNLRYEEQTLYKDSRLSALISSNNTNQLTTSYYLK